jgi:hypothetical protein
MASLMNYMRSRSRYDDWVIEPRNTRYVEDEVDYDALTHDEPNPSNLIDDEVDTYLSKMGSSKYDIEEIFAEVIDLGHKLHYSAEEFDNGHINKISISIDNDGTHEDISYLENVFHAISRFLATYKDKTMKINYEINDTFILNCYV